MSQAELRAYWERTLEERPNDPDEEEEAIANAGAWKQCAVGANHPALAKRIARANNQSLAMYPTIDEHHARVALAAQLTPAEVAIRDLGLRFSDAMDSGDGRAPNWDGAARLYREIEAASS